MTQYRAIEVSLRYEGKTILAAGKVTKKEDKDWELVREFSTSVRLDGKIVKEVINVIMDIAEKDYTTTHTFSEAIAEIEAEIMEFKD